MVPAKTNSGIFLSFRVLSVRPLAAGSRLRRLGNIGGEQASGGSSSSLDVGCGWQVEGIIKFGPNMASFLLISGLNIWYVAGVYVPPNNVLVVHCVEQ